MATRLAVGPLTLTFEPDSGTDHDAPHNARGDASDQGRTGSQRNAEAQRKGYGKDDDSDRSVVFQDTA